MPHKEKPKKDIDEIWMPIKKYVGFYEISNLGRVKSCSKLDKLKHRRREKMLKLNKSINGYFMVILSKQGIRKPFRIHRLVAIHFIKNPQNKPCVNHKDCNKLNNKYYNLEWVTQKENIQHSWENGRNQIPIGELNGDSKLTAKQVKEIRKIGKSKTLKEIGNKFGISFQHISSILNNKCWSSIK